MKLHTCACANDTLADAQAGDSYSLPIFRRCPVGHTGTATLQPLSDDNSAALAPNQDHPDLEDAAAKLHPASMTLQASWVQSPTVVDEPAQSPPVCDPSTLAAADATVEWDTDATFHQPAPAQHLHGLSIPSSPEEDEFIATLSEVGHRAPTQHSQHVIPGLGGGHPEELLRTYIPRRWIRITILVICLFLLASVGACMYHFLINQCSNIPKEDTKGSFDFCCFPGTSK